MFTGYRCSVERYDGSNIKNLNNIRMEQTNLRLTAANGLQMDVRGEIETIVKIWNKAEKIRFVIVKNLRPEMIGGIPLKKEFGIELQWKERNYQETERTYVKSKLNLEKKSPTRIVFKRH